MALILHVQGDRWRAVQQATLRRLPGLVPVIKGNGYGFGRQLLCGEAHRLGAPMIAVGTYMELPEALACFGGQVLVLEPYRAVLHHDLPDLRSTRVVHTVTAPDDVEDLRSVQSKARVVVEGLTSMGRFGMPLRSLAAFVTSSGAEGVTLHLPLGTGHVAEISRFVEAVPDNRRWFLSHVTASELGELTARFPDREFRPRVGTDLWLGDKGAYEVRADVLEVRALAKGERIGYRQRPQPAGHLVVVSGGTSHGVAMESPAAAATARQRAIAVAEGALEAAHRVRSPFEVSGVMPRFAEPPHMQCSLLVLPDHTTPPAVGDAVTVRMRLTTAYPDAVVLHPTK
ncbi:MAG: alanine racemase [Intrasporangium sp.]|uniref:alanine racemase n=1 Tax=Intrasporangium sp. TaxID=1925024 RepID=UPI002648A8A5|nr:alanine racemase [Intrasporangium sp.]MDN5797684.1 alanine racemase [Intrasporangium sp.]